MYGTSALAKLFKVSRETIRQWTIEFERHLSPGASVQGGRHRQYDDNDLEVLSLVASMREDNTSFEEIHASLEAGQRGELPENPRALISQTHTQQIRQFENQIEQLHAEIAQWRDLANQRVGENSLLRQQLADKESMIDKLKRRIWELESNDE